MSKKSVDKKTIRRRRARVMVFGTFDGLHEGHLNFFRQAREFIKNSFLIVSIARDENVIRIKRKKPDFSERERLALVKRSQLADKVVLGGGAHYLPHILKEKPDIIALGYDQRAYVPNLKKDLKNKDILVKIVRLKPYRERIYKNHLLKIKR